MKLLGKLFFEQESPVFSIQKVVAVFIRWPIIIRSPIVIKTWVEHHIKETAGE